MRHYIYRIEEKVTGEFYWGVRTCNCDPKDDPYIGSMVSWKPNKKNLVKTNIIEYDNRYNANIAEKAVISYYIDKDKFPLNRNYHIPGIGFHVKKKYKYHNLKINYHTPKKINKRKNKKIIYISESLLSKMNIDDIYASIDSYIHI